MAYFPSIHSLSDELEYVTFLSLNVGVSRSGKTYPNLTCILFITGCPQNNTTPYQYQYISIISPWFHLFRLLLSQLHIHTYTYTYTDTHTHAHTHTHTHTHLPTPNVLPKYTTREMIALQVQVVFIHQWFRWTWS